ncbi:MAG: hypothetical protein IKS23_04715 [Alphaproteobacteria bacterium]|nr:hypothetical protein [Alphaproteobacteria bacterium]
MADELNKDAEFGGKHKDEEDPILVAQRYLNIYHQIHIFNKERQDEFDDSLLSLSSDIRILLSTLPGGSVLLEHITELEETRGIISLMSQMDEKTTTKKSKGSKKKTQEEIAQEFASTPVFAETENSDNANAKVSNVDPNFSSAILKMLKQSEDKHERDMRTLTEALIQSQENMANVLKEVLTETRQQQPVSLHPAFQRQQEFVPSQTFSQQEPPSYLQPLPEDENPVETQNIRHSKPKLFSFTKKLFTSHKAAGTARDIERPLNPYVDNTPVSLDEIESDPVALDDEHKDEPQKLDISQDTAHTETSSENSSENSDWDWEYVDETPSDEKTSQETFEAEGKQEDDDEWEYVEVPEDDNLQNTNDSPIEDTAEKQIQETINQEEPTDKAPDDESTAQNKEQDVQDVLKDIEKQISDVPSDNSSQEQPDEQKDDLSETSETSLYQDNLIEQEAAPEPQAFEDSAFTYDETPEYEPGLESYQEPVFYNQEQADEFLNPQQVQNDNQDASSSYQVFDESAPLEYDSLQGDGYYQDGYADGNDQDVFVYDDGVEPLPEGESAGIDENLNPLPESYAPISDDSSLENALSNDEKSELDASSSEDASIDSLLNDFANEVNNTDESQETTKKNTKKGKNKNKKATED